MPNISAVLDQLISWSINLELARSPECTAFTPALLESFYNLSRVYLYVMTSLFASRVHPAPRRSLEADHLGTVR